MPLKRTPPPPTASPVRSESEPDLAASTSSRLEQGVTFRQKRPREEITMNDIMDNMKAIFKDFREEQDRKLDRLQGIITENRELHNKKLDHLQNKIAEIKQQNEDIHLSIEFLSQQNAELREKVSRMETEQKESRAYVKTLEDKIDTLERQSKSTAIEIRNIPVPKAESKEDLLKILQKVSSTLKVSVAASDVCDIFRISTKVPTDKPIICNLNSVLLRDKILRGLRDFNRTHKANKFSTEHIHIQGASQPIFVAESLTPKMRRLFFLARSFASSNSYDFCWVTRGRIYLRRKEGEPTIRIDSEADLVKVKASM